MLRRLVARTKESVFFVSFSIFTINVPAFRPS